jgi:hypothetical protein
VATNKLLVFSSKRWLLIASLVFMATLSILIYGYNQYYRKDSIGIEVVQGIVYKTSKDTTEIIQQRGEKLNQGDTLEVSKNGLVVLIFHDGSTLTFSNGTKIKYEYFKTENEQNHFKFSDLTQENTFEYVTQAYSNKTGAVILGRVNDASGTKSEILGVKETKISDTEKLKLWDNINKCMQQNNSELIEYKAKLQDCLKKENLENLDILSL